MHTHYTLAHVEGLRKTIPRRALCDKLEMVSHYLVDFLGDTDRLERLQYIIRRARIKGQTTPPKRAALLK